MAAVSSRCSGRPLDALPLLMNVCVLNGYTPGVQHRNICRAATWYSVHTFTKHYCLDSAWKEDAAVGQAVLRHLFASGCAALKRFETTAIRGHMLHIAGADENCKRQWVKGNTMNFDVQANTLRSKDSHMQTCASAQQSYRQYHGTQTWLCGVLSISDSP
ncbi:uncharacterized protein LOC144792272 isoform X4 [Lissotriton helveticus]